MMNDSLVHRHTWDQIPWMVNGTLPEGERPAVETHLAGCADCRSELEFQRPSCSFRNTLHLPDPSELSLGYSTTLRRGAPCCIPLRSRPRLARSHWHS